MKVNGSKDDLELMEARKQRIWRWPAAINFVLGGTGAGFYLFAALIELIHEDPGAFTHRAYPFPAPLLVCLGLLAVSFEAGRPFRAVHLLKRLQSSWISIEIMAGALFVFFATAGWIFPSVILLICSSSAALGFILSQGFIIYRARAITGWSVPLIPMLFFTTALAAGGGLLLILSSFLMISHGEITLMMVQAFIVMDVTAWAIYLTWSRDRNFIRATGLLRRYFSLFIISGIGHLLPFAAIAGLLVARQTGYSFTEFPITALVGAFIIFGVVSGKIFLILGVNFMRPMVLSGEYVLNLKRSSKFSGGTAGKTDA